MQWEENDIREFIQLWREEFREEIPIDEARHRATLLLELYALLAGLPVVPSKPSSGSPSGTHQP